MREGLRTRFFVARELCADFVEKAAIDFEDDFEMARQEIFEEREYPIFRVPLGGGCGW